MKAIKTKKQYEDAKFLDHSLRHRHNWKRLYIKKGKKKKFVNDKTGGFLKCCICDDVRFLSPTGMKKYSELRNKGVPTNEIQVYNRKTK